MILLCRRSVLALPAVADIAIHARPKPVAAKMLAERLDLPPRHLETLLQALVRADILKGVRGPRGGYELERGRRRGRPRSDEWGGKQLGDGKPLRRKRDQPHHCACRRGFSWRVRACDDR